MFTESMAAKIVEAKSDNRQMLNNTNANSRHISFNTDANTQRFFCLIFSLIKFEDVVYLYFL